MTAGSPLRGSEFHRFAPRPPLEMLQKMTVMNVTNLLRYRADRFGRVSKLLARLSNAQIVHSIKQAASEFILIGFAQIHGVQIKSSR